MRPLHPTKDSVNVVFRVDVEAAQKLERIAKLFGMSRSELIRSTTEILNVFDSFAQAREEQEDLGFAVTATCEDLNVTPAQVFEALEERANYLYGG